MLMWFFRIYPSGTFLLQVLMFPIGKPFLRLVFLLDRQRIAPPWIILPQHLDNLFIAYDCHTSTSIQVVLPQSSIFILIQLRGSYVSIL